MNYDRFILSNLYFDNIDLTSSDIYLHADESGVIDFEDTENELEIVITGQYVDSEEARLTLDKDEDLKVEIDYKGDKRFIILTDKNYQPALVKFAKKVIDGFYWDSKEGYWGFEL